MVGSTSSGEVELTDEQIEAMLASGEFETLDGSSSVFVSNSVSIGEPIETVQSENMEVDAVTGPTPAYASVDRGFGRTGYPAISMSAQAAKAFCLWLSIRTERTYTIPTLAQWEKANVGDGGAWHQWNAQKTTHPVATKEPNSLGVYDLRGNVGEWVITENGLRVVGGSFRTPAEDLGSASILEAEKSWNVTDPQLPRSPWWFADADYVGLRLVTTDGEHDE